MSVVEFVRTTAVEGKSAELRKALAEAVKRFPKQPGCTSARAFQAVEAEDPHVFFLTVVWDSLEAHLKWRDAESEGRIWFKENVRPFMSGTNLTGHFLPYAAS